MKVSILIKKGPESGREFIFERPATFLVGSAEDCHLRFPLGYPNIVPHHFLVEISPPKCVLNDLNSAYPPYVNGKRAFEYDLKNRDVIELSGALLQVSISEIVNHLLCKKCGAAITIAVGDRPELCDDCLKMQPKSTGKPDWVPILCQCGLDLSKKANSDGRAKELLGEVEYYCPKCVGRIDDAQRIGEYSILGDVAESGIMGKVYLVYHEATSRVLAMKKFHELRNDQLIKRFEREVRFTSELVHENLVRYLDSGVDGKEPYLVMQYVRGRCLFNLLCDNERRFHPEEAVRYIAGALKGLEVMHNKKIIHGSIRPENILIRVDKSGKVIPKLTDFGLTKKYIESGGTVLNQTPDIFFPAPEQILDPSQAKEPADLYSMGIVLYYLLTLQIPYDYRLEFDEIHSRLRGKYKRFDEEEITEINNAIWQSMGGALINIALSREPKSVLQRDPSLPASLARVIDKAIRKDMKERYQSAGEFRKELLNSMDKS